MGRLPADCSARLDHDAMNRFFRALVFLSLGLLLGGSFTYAFAGSVRYELRGVNVTREGGQTHIRGTSPTETAALGVSGGVVSVVGASKVGGSTAEFVTTAALSSGAASVALSAIRLNPAGLIGSAVAGWLLTQGIEYVQGQMMTHGPAVPVVPEQGTGTCQGTGIGNAASFGFPVVGATDGECQAKVIAANAADGITLTLLNHTSAQYYWHWTMTSGSSGDAYAGSWSQSGTIPEHCPDGYSKVSGVCVRDTMQPAGDSDFAPLASAPLPDAPAKEIIQKGGELPIEPPVFEPKYRDVPMSDPYKDPVSDKTVKDVARVTPQPMTPETAKLEVTKQEVNPETGEPVTDPVTGEQPAPEKQTDFCVEHPDALACWEAGDPEDLDLESDTRSIEITPQSGWGAVTASCPNPRTHTLRNGYTVAMSWVPVCDAASMFRPVVIGMAWLAAIYAAMAIQRKAQS